MNPTDYSYSEDGGGGGGFGPKSPTNETAIERADEEAAIVGNMALYCMSLGAIPHVPMRGFWRVHGVCRGMMVDGLQGVERVCRHLRVHLGDVLRAEGIELYLRQAEDIRALSKAMFPNEDPDWLTIEEAMEYTGKSRKTIMDWVRAGGMRTLDDRWGMMIHRQSLQMKQAIILGNMFRRMNHASKFNRKR